MEVDFRLQSLLALWSIVTGAFLCAVYDVFRVMRIRRRQNAAVMFLFDLAFCLIASVTMSVLFFNLSFGKMRAFSFVLAVVGFLVWRFTVSRLVMYVMNLVLDRLIGIYKACKLYMMSRVARAYSRLSTAYYCRKTVREVKTLCTKGIGNEQKDTHQNESCH